MKKTISKEALGTLFDSLRGEYEVIGPVKIANKGVFYQPIAAAGDLYLGDEFTVEPVKRYFLEPSGWLTKNTYGTGKVSIEDTPLPAQKRFIIGVRPCEARGLELLDKVFNSSYKDKFYINNRERTVLIGLACAAPDKTCFCTSIGGTPVDTRGMDAVIYMTGSSPEVMVEAVTEKGKDIFASAGESLPEGRVSFWQEEKERMKGRIIKKPAVRDALGGFESAYWEEVAGPCVSCGVCTYLCPTCHCFDLVEEDRKRLRCYDGCSFKDFTQEASGENPRPTKRERYRQRVFHKFDYFRKNFGEHLCVGCGRCIRHCPVKIDIAEIAAGAPKD